MASVIIMSLPAKARVLVAAVFVVSLVNYIIIIISNDKMYDHQFALPDITDRISSNYKDGDIVLAGFEFSRSDFNYYLPDHIESIGLYPLNFIVIDFLSTRRTLGIVGNESQLSSFYHDDMLLDLKMKYLIKKCNAKGVWLVFLDDYRKIHEWLFKNGFKERKNIISWHYDVR